MIRISLSIAEKFKELQEENLKEAFDDYNNFLDEYFTNNVFIFYLIYSYYF